MQGRARRKVKDAILRSRIPLKGPLARVYLRVIERLRTLHGDSDRRFDVNGVAIPPARLRVLVAGTADIDRFLHSGEVQAEYLRELLGQVHRPLDEMDAILDFGCGCGRIARWFSGLARPRLHGCDYNGELVEWCEQNLDFLDSRRNGLAPPLPYPDESFDFLYAFSVFTHLSVELAERWMAELRRVIKPGGLMWFTIHGESYRERLLPEQRARFDNGEIVVWLPEIEGTNMCGAYWPEASVAGVVGGQFEILVHFDPRAEPTKADHVLLAHDAYLLRRL